MNYKVCYLNSIEFIILLTYIDDILIIKQDKSMIKKLKKELSISYAMKDLRRHNRF